MKAASIVLLMSLAFTLSAAGQGAPARIKGRIVDFDGLTFHLAPEKGPNLAIRLQSRTQFMTMTRLDLSAFKPGTYAGATVRETDGTLMAEEVHLYPAAMRGSSEGRVALGGGRFVVTGAVTAAAAGSLNLSYRGARMDGGVCLDRADPKASSPACTGDVAVRVPDGAVINALTPTTRRMLVPGAIATVTIETDAKGTQSTPGMILEKP